MKISIGITTTPNRKKVFEASLAQWQKLLPNNAEIFVHCDAEYKGVVDAKNKVLAMCYDSGADYLFIVDDDLYPLTKDWWQPYTTSPLNHACWNYDRCILSKGDIYNELQTPNGCMLYFKKIAIKTCGGWDTDFKGYGYEHVNLSDRVYNNGLTPGRYIDIPDSKRLFALADCESSFTYADRAQIPVNYELYQQKFYSKEFKPFK